jgi:hypothetical protein
MNEKNLVVGLGNNQIKDMVISENLAEGDVCAKFVPEFGFQSLFAPSKAAAASSLDARRGRLSTTQACTQLQRNY